MALARSQSMPKLQDWGMVQSLPAFVVFAKRPSNLAMRFHHTNCWVPREQSARIYCQLSGAP